MTSVRFANSQYFDPEERAVTFTAFAHNRVIRCSVSAQALAEHFGSDFRSPVACFVRQRHTVERIADLLIESGRFEADGSIRIRMSDCESLRKADADAFLACAEASA
jgi:hypothetical protein